MVQRFVLHGSCHAIDEAAHFEIKNRIATHFGIEVSTDVFVVGSAKLGFSIAPTKRWRPFGDYSDIDVAIVNHDLYQKVWHELHEYFLSGADWPNRGRFVKFLAQGWIRPDLLPPSPLFEFVGEWWQFFRDLKREQLAGACKIAAGLYHDVFFLQSYQAGAIASCREGLES